MADTKIRAALLHLGSNMWRKKGFESSSKKDVEDFIYRDSMYCQKHVWEKVTGILSKLEFNTLFIDIGEGVLFDSHPEIAIPGAWTKAELSKEIARLRSIGLDPCPKFNFSPGHSAWMGDWAYRIGTPEFYEFCKDIIEETIDIFGKPTFFHIGMEEEDYNAQKNNYIAVVRCPRKKTEDTKYLMDIIIRRGVRPVIWMDIDTLNNFGGPEYFADNMPRETLLMPWGYGIIRDVENLEDACDHAKHMMEIAKLGYDMVPTTSTWCWHLNSKETMIFCKKHLPDEVIAGYMTASWMLTRENKFFQLVNDAYTFYTAYRDVYGTLPETDRMPWDIIVD